MSRLMSRSFPLRSPSCHEWVFDVVQWAAVGAGNTTPHFPASNAADAPVATGASDVVRAQPLGIVAIGRVLRTQRLPEGDISTTTAQAHYSLVLGTVQVCHHPRTHQQVGLHFEPCWDAVMYVGSLGHSHRLTRKGTSARKGDEPDVERDRS